MEEMAISAILAVWALLYAAGIRLDAVTPRRRLQIAAFALGWLCLAAALVPPLDDWAAARLWAHMTQHELIIVAAAPLLALGRSDLALAAVLNRRSHRLLGRWLQRLQIGMPAAWTLHAAALWGWHLPLLYDAALAHAALHALEHASYLGSALLFWWTVFKTRPNYGAAAVYTFGTSLHTGVLGALLFLSPQSWYPAYGAGPAALEDQQLAGLIMWVPGGAILALTALLLFWRWLDDMEHRVTTRERLGDLHPMSPTAGRATCAQSIPPR